MPMKLTMVGQDGHGEKHMVHLFRKGLRLHDNPSLRQGLDGCTTFRCIFILDPWFAGSSVGINKWRFLLQSLEDLDGAYASSTLACLSSADNQPGSFPNSSRNGARRV